MLDAQLQADVARIVSKWPAVEKVVLFGSRAQGKFSRSSDIDLALFGKNLSDRDVSLIRDSLENEVKTALQFDVVHFESLNKKELKEEILNEGVSLYESKAH